MGMPVPAFARPPAINPMPALPVAKKISTGKCPQCPLPLSQCPGSPRAEMGMNGIPRFSLFNKSEIQTKIKGLYFCLYL